MHVALKRWRGVEERNQREARGKRKMTKVKVKGRVASDWKKTTNKKS